MDSTYEIIPIGTRLWIETDVVEEKTEGGIFLPDSVRDQQSVAATRGKILAMGDDAFCELEEGSNTPEVGDRVIMARYAGLELENENQRLVEDDDIVAVLRSEE